MASRTTDYVNITSEKLAELLEAAGMVVPEEFETTEDNTTALRILVDGTPITLQLQHATLSLDDYTHLTQAPHRVRSRYAQHRNVKDPTMAYLQQHNLPLYWNREWLADRLAELGTYAEIARTHKLETHGVNSTTIANYARDNFGWDQRRVRTGQRDKVVLDYEANHESTTQLSLASKYGVSVSTINRWIHEAHAAYRELQEGALTGRSGKKKIEEFAQEHKLEPDTIRHWIKDGSPVYGEDVKKQAKSRYYTKEEYEKKFETVRKIFEKAGSGSKINKRALAKELSVDRSTITTWIQTLER